MSRWCLAVSPPFFPVSLHTAACFLCCVEASEVDRILFSSSASVVLFGSYPGNHHLHRCLTVVSLYLLPATSVSVHSFIFRSLLHLKFIFTYGEKSGSNFILLHTHSCLPAPVIGKTSLSPLHALENDLCVGYYGNI